MKTSLQQKDSYIRAKEKLRNLKIFYVHLIGYFILIALLSYNLYILDETNIYSDLFFKLIIIFMVSWTVFIAFHAWNVFKGRLFFKQSWEDKKLKEYMDHDNNTNLWE